ncbi:hypothetical protein Droror1_Dr00011591 [Drosera rotundifolia]
MRTVRCLISPSVRGSDPQCPPLPATNPYSQCIASVTAATPSASSPTPPVRSLSGRRLESSSTDNHNIPKIEGEIPVPNLPNMLPLDGVPSGNSASSLSSSSLCSAKETGNRPTEKPHKPKTQYYGEPFFSGDLLSQKVIDKYWRGFKKDQGRSFSGRRLVPPSSGNNGIPMATMVSLILRGNSPPGISKPSSSSVSPFAMEKTGDTPEQKPLEQIIVRWDPSISDLVRRDYEKTCA